MRDKVGSGFHRLPASNETPGIVISFVKTSLSDP